MSDPDFEIRHLSAYDTDDLELLQKAVDQAYRKAKEFGNDADAQAYDVWGYRIRDAIKESKENL